MPINAIPRSGWRSGAKATKVLVVDDDRMNRVSLRQLLCDEGRDVLEAEDGAAALVVARSHRPDLVVTDLIMPVMDGFELLRQLRADPDLAETPVIFYTAGYRGEEARDLARRAGVDVLSKPSERGAVLAAIDHALRHDDRAGTVPLPTEFDQERLRLMTDELSHKVAELEAANTRLDVLRRIDRAILEARSVEAVASTVLGYLRTHAGLDYGCVRLIEPGGTSLDEPLLAFGKKSADAQPELQSSDFLRRLRDGETIAKDPSLWVPLRCERELVGVLECESPSAPTIAPVVENVAASLTIAIRSARMRSAIGRHAGELENRVVERTAELREANAELESFSYSVTHDLRNPLTVISGFAELLAARLGEIPIEKAKQYADRILAGTDLMGSLIDGLLEYCRIGRAELHPEPIAISDVVSAARAQLEGAISRRGAEIVVDEPSAIVVGHKLVLTQALVNLIGNAIKYVADGVTPRIRVRTEERAGAVRIWIEDNGIGIPSEARERIFGLFEQAHQRQSFVGSGVGLAIVKRGIERIGGRCGVESEIGAGSRFWIELPAVGDEAGDADLAARPPVILVVEDDPINLEYVRTILECRYVVLAATNPEEARALLAAEHGRIAAVVMDVQLGGATDGIDLTREMRESRELRAIPVVATTALSDSADRERALAAGCNAFIAKPFAPGELSSAIARMLEERGLEAQPSP